MDLIDRRSALNALCDNCDNVQAVCAHYPCKQYIAVEKLPSEEPYNFDEWCEGCKEYDHERHCCPRFNRVIRTAMEEAKPKTGRWISHDRNAGNTKCRTLLYCLPTCSVCGYCADYTNFCPNCGAYMGGDHDA